MPVANEFGVSLVITPTLGFGTFAFCANLSIISCNTGYSSFETSFVPVLHRTILSEKYHCAPIINPAIMAIGSMPKPKYAEIKLKNTR